jgi:hypothetical protein
MIVIVKGLSGCSATFRFVGGGSIFGWANTPVADKKNRHMKKTDDPNDRFANFIFLSFELGCLIVPE